MLLRAKGNGPKSQTILGRRALSSRTHVMALPPRDITLPDANFAGWLSFAAGLCSALYLKQYDRRDTSFIQLLGANVGWFIAGFIALGFERVLALLEEICRKLEDRPEEHPVDTRIPAKTHPSVVRVLEQIRDRLHLPPSSGGGE